MKNLYVRTTCEELEIKNIEASDIKEDEQYIIFGEKAKVKKDYFVCYQFIEVEKSE